MTVNVINDQIVPVPPAGATDFEGPTDGLTRRVSPYQFVTELAGSFRSPGSEKQIHVSPTPDVTVSAWAYMASFQGFDKWVSRIEEREIVRALERVTGTRPAIDGL